MFSILMGRMRDMSQYRGVQLIEDLQQIPQKMESILKKSEQIAEIAKKYAGLNNFLFLGRGISYPVVMEAALKLKEVSYVHSEGYAAGEIKHGPIALVDKNTPVVFVVPQDHLHDKMVSNIQEVKARGGRLIAVCNEGDEKIRSLVEDVIEVPKTEPLFSPLLTILPLQLMSYYVAKELGCDIDQPRNLAKSVTVE